MLYVKDEAFICLLQKLDELETRLVSLNSHDENSVRSAIEDFSLEVQLDEDSVLKRLWMELDEEFPFHTEYLMYLRS